MTELCVRCGKPASMHVEVIGTGLVCPMGVPTWKGPPLVEPGVISQAETQRRWDARARMLLRELLAVPIDGETGFDIERGRVRVVSDGLQKAAANPVGALLQDAAVLRAVRTVYYSGLAHAADCGCEACLVLRDWARAGAKDGGGR